MPHPCHLFEERTSDVIERLVGEFTRILATEITQFFLSALEQMENATGERLVHKLASLGLFAVISARVISAFLVPLRHDARVVEGAIRVGQRAATG